jgi:dTDP-4-dehydrorhamnose reductase
MKPIVILGAGGMLGRTFARVLAATTTPYVALTRADLDVTDAEAVATRLGGEARTILNCTAYTDVDGAEVDEAAADALNATAVETLASVAKRSGSLLVHFSTDYVFDGTSNTPYAVDAPRAPQNAYGRSKAKGERALETSGADYLLVRTSWLYAPFAKNFVRTIAGAARTRPSLRVVSDQRGRPTSTFSLADTTLALIGRDARGPFHVTDAGEATWFDLATEVARFVAPACAVEPCATSEFPRPAPRPAYSVLDISATEATLGRALSPWQDALADVLARLE